tara:strand:- start:102 stop:482 length:381 start_codon:yes stop_codon:yes gene_type:complete
MVRYYDYEIPKEMVLNEIRTILISLDYEIDIYAPETNALTTKNTRLRKTIRKYDYVLYVKVSDRIEVHISAKRNIFRRGSETNLGKYDQIIEQTEDKIPSSLQKKIYFPIQKELKKIKEKNKISFY